MVPHLSLLVRQGVSSAGRCSSNKMDGPLVIRPKMSLTQKLLSWHSSSGRSRTHVPSLCSAFVLIRVLPSFFRLIHVVRVMWFASFAHLKGFRINRPDSGRRTDTTRIIVAESSLKQDDASLPCGRHSPRNRFAADCHGEQHPRPSGRATWWLRSRVLGAI